MYSTTETNITCTKGGNPVACAVGISVLDVIEEEKLQKNALEGDWFKLLYYATCNSLKDLYCSL